MDEPRDDAGTDHPEPHTRGRVSALLGRWREGDATAVDALVPLVYEELRRLARRAFWGERSGHTLQTTALVHEAYERLVGAEVDWQDRAHFFAVAAQMMRRILVDHSRAARSKKRGGNGRVVALDGNEPGRVPPTWELIDVDRALSRLAERAPRKAQVLEMHYFAGLTSGEIGQVLGISGSTVRGELRLARAWLRRELAP